MTSGNFSSIACRFGSIPSGNSSSLDYQSLPEKPEPVIEDDSAAQNWAVVHPGAYENRDLDGFTYYEGASLMSDMKISRPHLFFEVEPWNRDRVEAASEVKSHNLH